MPRRLVTIVLIALGLVGIAGTALAKGPTVATIDGPGLKEPIVIEGSGEFGSGNDFAEFVEATGFWHLVFGPENLDSELGEVIETPPSKDLGVAYVITWDVLGSEIKADVYPLAKSGPLVHVEPGQPLPDFDGDAVGGWFSAAETLRERLVGYGVLVGDASLPPQATVGTQPPVQAMDAPPGPATITRLAPPTGPMSWVLAAGAMGTGVLAFWALRRRPRRTGAP